MFNNKTIESKKKGPTVFDREQTFVLDKNKVSTTDADTFRIKGATFNGTVRLSGADAPELSVYDKYRATNAKERAEAKKHHEELIKKGGSGYRRSPVEYITQDFGKESRAASDQFIKSSKQLTLTYYGTDDYGRTLGSLSNEKGEKLNDYLVKQGLAMTELPSSPYFEGSLESYQRYENMVEAYENKQGIFSKEDFVNPTNFRKGEMKSFKKRLDTEIRSESYKKQGLANNEYAYILADEDTYFTLSASLGASAHYGASLESNLMEQAGYHNMSSVVPYKGLAESLMEYNNVMLGNKPLSGWEKFAAQAYDSGLSAGGVGNWLNREIFIPRGWGRVYKDEVGALPSIAGLVGKILDESYLYYANINPDWATIGHDFKSGLGYGAMEEQAGVFETMFQNTSSFVLSGAQSLGMYLAITQPMELLTANISKSFLDRSIEGTILDNTAPDGRPLPKNRAFNQVFMAEYYFGDLADSAAKPGGLAAAVLQQKIEADNLGKPVYFDHNQGAGTAFKAMMMIQRGRAQRIMEGTFKPFLIDVVNPFNPSTLGTFQDSNSPTGARRINSYDKFNRAVNQLIQAIAAPVDLDIKFKPGQSVEFKGVTLELSDISDDIKLGEAKVNRSGVKVIDVDKVPIQSYSGLANEYSKYNNKLNNQLIENNEELYKLLTNPDGPNLSDEAAKNFIFNKESRAQILSQTGDRIDVLLDRKYKLETAKKGLRSQLGAYADKLEIGTTNTGIKYKTNIAAALQEILDMTPLNPLKWGLFNSSAEMANEFLSVGQLFSFRDAAEYAERVITGNTSIAAVFKQYEPITADPFEPGKRLSIDENLSNKVLARLTSLDGIIGEVWKNIKSFWRPEPTIGPDIKQLTSGLRDQEIKVAKAAEKAKVEGFKFNEIQNSLDPNRASVDVVVGNVNESVDLLDSVLEYSYDVRSKGGLSHIDMAKAIDSAGIKDITGHLMRTTNKFSGNIKAEGILGESKGIIAASIFLGLALNNVMQSTSGTSIITQVGFALYGENEDLAVKYEANRFAPTEVITVALNNIGIGISQTATNFIADSVFIGGTLALGHKIAKSMTTTGYLPYTFDLETVKKMADREGIEVTLKNTNTIVDSALLDNMAPGHDNYITIKKGAKETVLTRTVNGFKSERILQEFAENVPTKTFIFGSIALLTTNALRQSAATMLGAMSESPDDKYYGGIFAGLVGGGFMIGARLDKVYQGRAIAQGAEIAQAGGQVVSKEGVKRLLHTKAARWAIGGALIGATIWAGKLALDPDIKQKGSLDPLIAGASLGIGVGIFKSSAGLGLAAGLVAMSVMSALNWAGIRVFELGRGGNELDPEKAKLVSQLANFSSAVLANENSLTTFNIGMAAYASQFGSTKSILGNTMSSDETQVIAKQSPLPVLQFFVAEKIEGRRGEIYTRSGPDSESTTRKYTLGIQSGALLGTSISVELPIAYTPGRGFFGFTYNSDNNLMAVPNFALKVGIWAALGIGGIGITFQGVGAFNQAAFRMTKAKMFEENARNFGKAAEDLFSVSRFMLSAAEKISSFFIRTTVGIFSTLQGVDASMAYQTYKNSVSKTQQAADMIRDMSVADLSTALPEEQAKLNSLDNVDGAKNAWSEIKAGSVLKYAERSKHLAVGALLGSIAGGLTSDLIKHFRLASSTEANESYETLVQIEDQEERRKMLYVAIGGSAGAITNDIIRSSNSLIKHLSTGHSTAVKDYLTSKSVRLNSFYEKTELLVSKVGTTFSNNKYTSKIPINKIKPFVKATTKLLTKNKHVGIFIAATLYNYVKIDSEFGIAKMMDRHIVYDDKGNAYQDYEQQTKYNFIHHAGTAGLLGAGTLAIASITISPGRSQRETILEFAKRELASLDGGLPKTASILNKVKHHASNILFAAHRFGAEKETQALLKSILQVDNEFAEYKEWQQGRLNNSNIAIPKKLEKVEDVLKLRAALGKEELKEFIALRNRKNSGMPLDIDEQSTYKNFLKNVESQLSQVDEMGLPKYKNLNKGFKQTSNLTSFSKRATIFLGAALLTKFVITTVGNQGGMIGGDASFNTPDSYLDRLYNKANQVGKIGQRRQDGSRVGFEGIVSIIADAARIITGRDVVNLNYAVNTFNSRITQTTGQRLVSNAKGAAHLQKTVKDLSEMLIVDNPNAYLATLSFGGNTLRNGDKGVTTSSYFQLQGPAQDISTATYSMASKFIFKEYTSGRGKLGSVVDKGMATFDPKNPDTWQQAAVNIRNASSMMDAMKDARTFSRQGMETSAALAGDSLASLIIAARQEELAHIAWQPVDSLFTNMFFETMDKAKHRMDDKKLVKFLEGIARSNKNVLDTFAKLMEEGIFENFFTKSAITNVIFFTGSFGKPPKHGNAQFMATDIGQLWHQTHDISVQAEMFKQSRVEIFDNFMDKVVMPLSSSGIFAIIPEWMKVGGLAIATVSLSAVIMNEIAKYTDTKTWTQSTSELLDVFGRVENTVGPKMAPFPNDLERIRKELIKHLEEGKKYTWSFSKDNQGIINSPIVTGTAGNESKYVGLLNIGQDGKPLHVRFEINPYFDILSGSDKDTFVKTLEAKGDQLRNLFAYTEETLDESGKVIASQKRTIVEAVLDHKNVSKWLEKIGAKDSVYDVFKGTGAVSITKTEFIGKAVENLQSKFEQGLTKLYDLGNVDKMNHHLFQVVKVNGEEVLVGELLNPDFKTPGVDNTNDFGPATSIEHRKQMLANQLEKQKQNFLNEVQEIVQEEYEKIKINGKAANVMDDTAQIAEANRRALLAIKTRMGDPSSAIGAVVKGAGIVQATSLVDQQSNINKINNANNRPGQTIRTNRATNSTGNPVDDFVDDMLDSLHYTRPMGNVGAWDMMAAGGKGLMNAGFTLFDVLTGADILGAYLRTAEVLDNKFATNLDKEMAGKELGRAILSSAIGVVVGLAGNKLLGLAGNPTVKKFITNPANIAKGGIALIAGGIGLTATWKSIIQPGLKKLSGLANDNHVTKKSKDAFDNAWYAAGDVVGKVAMAPVIGAYNFGKHFGVAKEAAYFTAGFLGGGLMSTVVMLGAVGLLGIGASISLPVLAATAAGIGLVTGVAAIFGGKKMTSGMTYATREINKIPGAAILGLTDPYRQIRNQERFKHHFTDSPFMLGYVGDLVNSNWMQMLAAAENPGGRDTVALLFGDVLGEGNEYAGSLSAWKQNAADSKIGGPKPIIDDVIQNELRIRAEGYSDAVIGRYSWDQVLEHADNSQAIRAMEAMKRAERVKILEQARARAVKASIDNGGASAALKVNSGRKTAVTQQQIAKVDQVIADLDTYGKPKVQVTAATLTTHKSNAVNSNQDNIDAAKAQTLQTGGAGVASITKAHVYKTRAYVDNKIAVVDVSKHVDPMNPILQHQEQIMTVDTSPDTQIKIASYTAHKNQK